MSAPCQTSSFRACAQLENNELPSEAPLHDPRVQAAVIVDPLPAFLLPADNLKAVTIPVQSWSSDPSLNADHLSGGCAAQINQASVEARILFCTKCQTPLVPCDLFAGGDAGAS